MPYSVFKSKKGEAFIVHYNENKDRRILLYMKYEDEEEFESIKDKIEEENIWIKTSKPLIHFIIPPKFIDKIKSNLDSKFSSIDEKLEAKHFCKLIESKTKLPPHN